MEPYIHLKYKGMSTLIPKEIRELDRTLLYLIKVKGKARRIKATIECPDVFPGGGFFAGSDSIKIRIRYRRYGAWNSSNSYTVIVLSQVEHVEPIEVW